MNGVLLLEQSFANAAKAIEGAVDLPAQTGTQWLCSLRKIAKALSRWRSFQRAGRRRALPSIGCIMRSLA
jgi:hypothetical protein